jgi:predicted  nucleic acid-binding Zn-ribbon protein
MRDQARRKLDQAKEVIEMTKLEVELLKSAIRETRRQIEASRELLRRTPSRFEIRPLSGDACKGFENDQRRRSSHSPRRIPS